MPFFEDYNYELSVTVIQKHISNIYIQTYISITIACPPTTDRRNGMTDLYLASRGWLAND